MILSAALTVDRILVPLAVAGRVAAIDALLAALPLDTATRAVARAAVLEREEEITTGIGGGVAIPHARVAGIDRPLLALGIVPDGLDFDAIDGEPVRLVFLCVAGAAQSPPAQPDGTGSDGDGSDAAGSTAAGAHGALLAALCTLLNDAGRRERLAASRSAAEARAVLDSAAPRAAARA